MELEPKIVILLSTYNGEDYLAEQLDSLLKQTYSNFIIIIRDDASTDSTEQIINHYVERNQGKIHKLSSINSNVGPSSSFGLLIKYVIKEKTALGFSRLYMMLCDQDDIWTEKKLEVQMSEMLNAEQKSPDVPILVHSDLKVVDESKKVIAESFVEYQGLEIKRNKFTNIVISNLVTGCTALFNEELAQIALPIPDTAIMHDWWLALIASAFGRVIHIDMPLVEYRQHQNNTIGAKEFENKYGRDLCLNISMISFLPEVKPPIAPPKAFPKVEVIISTLPITLQCSCVPLPVCRSSAALLA